MDIGFATYLWATASSADLRFFVCVCWVLDDEVLDCGFGFAFCGFVFGVLDCGSVFCAFGV